MRQVYRCYYYHDKCEKRSSFVDASQAKQKRQIKIVNSILVKGWTRFFNNERQVIDLIDLRAKINLINYVYVVQWELQSTFAILSILDFFDNDDRFCYDVYELIYHLIDSWG